MPDRITTNISKKVEAKPVASFSLKKVARSIQKRMALSVFAGATMLATQSSAQTGTALDLTSLSNYVNITNMTGLPTGNSDWTVEFRYFTPGGQNGHRWITWLGNNSADQTVVIGFDADNGNRIRIHHLGSDLIASTASIPVNQWVQVSVTYRGSLKRNDIYINGVYVESINFPNNLNLVNTNFQIGTYASQTSNFNVNGKLDDFRVWNAALSCDEINQRKSCELTGSESGLVAYYNFNQGTAGGTNTSVTTLIDVAGGNNNGTLAGFTLSGPTDNWVAPAGALSGACGTVTTPEINITGNSVTIPDGTTSVATSNNTDFGTVLTGTSAAKTFTIQNTGTSDLTVTGITLTGAGAARFAISGISFPKTIAPAGSATFTTTYTPVGPGAEAAVVNIANTDCDEAVYDFAVGGTALQQGAALDFDGTDDYVTTGPNASLDLPTQTVEFWAKPTAADANDMVIGKRDASGVARWSIHFVTGLTGILLYNGVSGNVTYNYAFTPGQWYHIAVVTSGTTSSLYVNGTFVQSQTFAINTAATNVQLLMGRASQSAPGFEVYQGLLDEVRIWDHARTCAQIDGFKNCEMAGTESGLKAYYNFNAGIGSGTNTGINTLTDATGAANGTLQGFALAGASSNWVNPGAVTTGVSCAATGSSAVTATSSATASISGNNTLNLTNVCRDIAAVTPSGASPVTGSITARVFVDASAPAYNGQAYLRRRYDISAANSPNTATAMLTLYYTQADFDNYNLAQTNDALDLPANGTAGEAAKKANFRLTQYHGTSATAMPGTYTYSGGGSPKAVIDPDDNQIVWNAGANRWEVTFPITGFSGFFAYGVDNLFPLPVKLESFTAYKSGAHNELSWKTGIEMGNNTFVIERSSNGRSFTAIGELVGKGRSAEYSFRDDQPANGANYYRLKMAGSDGTADYSRIVMVYNAANGGVVLSPVPATSSVTIANSDGSLNGTAAAIYDMQGRKMHEFLLKADQSINISGWPAGIYSVRLSNGQVLPVVKQ